MKLGDIVKKYREEHDLSMRQFAKQSGLSHAYIPLIEKGLNANGYPLTPSITVMKRLADAMGMTLNDLMAMTDDDMEVDLSYEANSIVSDLVKQDFPLTEHEKRLVEAYRANPNMQEAVDKLLGVEPEGRTVEEDIADTIRRIEKERTPIG